MKPTIKQRKALRRAAALKGWETRRKGWIAPKLSEAALHWADMARISEALRVAMNASPDPTPATPNWLHKLWAKITGTA